ncbi:hypothetical protein BOX15_Mlig032894g2 [Macrostomum lignano]|uniref:DAAF9 N-terminal domain-containing protein n=1 Tax=Macrostomum lignano TaxID=282301 RepID=A0A267GJX6_9PLAT|nr:hypothetical protein BOX15_Mlig032894g2 [Macrostomum lignano]
MPIFSSSVRPKCDLTVTRYKNFSVQICQDRLATIQSLVRNDETLLVVCGIDSHFSQGSQQLFDYLLFNVNQKRAAEIERTKLEDEHFDDVVLSIRRNRVQVYLNPANYWFYLPYVACWPNLDIHCAPDALFDDQDAMEELKMKFLIQAVDGCNSVCVAYYGKDHLAESAGFSPMLVEKWPLIQAYAVDGFGVGTFFTLKHQLRDVSKDVFGLIQSVDAVAVEDLTDKPLKPFKNQFDSVFQTIDFLAGRSEPQLVLEEKSLNQLIEPFRSYARHEMTGKSELSAGGVRAGQHPSLRSYLAFDTRRSAIDLLAKTASTEPAAINRPFAPLAANFIVQSEDRIHSLVCARTGFLHWNLPEDKRQLQQELQTFNRDLNYVYSRMVQVVRNKMSSVNADFEFDSLHSQLSAELSQQLGIPESLIQVSTEVLRPAQSTAKSTVNGKKPQQLRVLSCSVYDLTPESLNESQWSASVAFADTYFVTECQGSQCLTADIPTACHWSCEPTSAAVQRLLADSAAPADDVTAEDSITASNRGRLVELTASIDGDAAAAGAEMVAACLNRGRVLLYSQRECAQQVLRPGRARLLPGGDSLDQPCRLAFDLADSAAPVPDWCEHLLSSGRQLRLLLAAGSRSKRDFFAKVAPVWRSEGFLAQAEEAAPPTERSNAEDEDESGTAGGAVLVWGHLGSFSETLAQELASSTGVLIDLLHCDSAAEAAKIFAADWQPGTPPVVLCPSLVTPQALLRAFDAGAKPASVASIVVCVNSHTAVVSGRCRTQPGLLDSLAEAACSVVVLTAPSSEDLVSNAGAAGSDSAALVEDPAAAELSRLLRLVNAQSARVIRAPQGRLPATTGAAALIPPEVPSWRQLIRQQRRQPRQLLLSSELDLGWLGLSRVSVTFSRPLERDKLADRLRMLSAGSQKTKRPTQQADELLQSKFYYVSGIAPVKQGNSKPQWLRFWRHCGADSSCLLPAKAKSDAGFTTAKVVAFGRGLETEDLKRMLRLCAPLKPTRRALMIRSDLTPAAVARIHKERHLDPLPEGWFFNGTKYISFDGESSKMHPSLEKFLESHIAEENKKIAEYNAKLAAGSEWRDLFDN